MVPWEVRTTMFYHTHGKNDVKASVYNAWQISPICRMLLVGAFVLDGTKPSTEKIMVGSCRRAQKGLVLPSWVGITETVNM